MTTNGIRVPTAKWLPTPLLSDGFGSAFGVSDGLGNAEGLAGGIGAGGSGVTLSNAGGTWSVSGGKAINTPSVGAELLTNGDFSAWTGDNPDGWTLPVAEDGSNYATEIAGTLHFVAASASPFRMEQNALTAGNWYRGSLSVSSITGKLLAASNLGGPSRNITATGTNIWTGRAGGTFVRLWAGLSGAVDAVVDDWSFKPLILSELLTISNLSCADVYAGVAITKSNTYVQAGLALNWDSASSPANGLIVYLSGGNIYVDKCVAGTWTNVSSKAYTYSAGARLVSVMNAGALRTYYNGALVKADTIVDAGILTGQLHGLFSSDQSNQFDGLTIYATGTGGEYSQLDSY